MNPEIENEEIRILENGSSPQSEVSDITLNVEHTISTQETYGEPLASGSHAEEYEEPAVLESPLNAEILISEDSVYAKPSASGSPSEEYEEPAALENPANRNVPEWRLRKRGEARPSQVSEPAYTEASYGAPNDVRTGMFTPGIYLNAQGNNAKANKREILEPAAEEPPVLNKRRGRAGGFLRAACLVIVCAIFSAAATYAVMEYRIRAGHNTTVNQVVLGSPSAGHQYGNITTPVVSANRGMAPEDIYDMALTQVVGIKTDVPTAGAFGTVRTSTAAGSGFIISSDGYILTNYHVIEAAAENGLPIRVIMSDGAEFEAEVIGYEVANDVALIKIEAHGLNPAILGNSDNIRVGQSIFAIGNPLGNLVYTMTDGIVSALDRDVTVEGKVINTFQFSAAVNSGNSGGPIYDSNGEVIGIVTAKLSRSDVEGIGFAIPINDAIEIASGLIEFGYIAGRPLLGITGQSVTRANAEYYGMVVGAIVRAVNQGSAADTAGVEIGDIIVGLGEAEIVCMDSLRTEMRRYRAGDSTTLSVWRDGTVYDLDITFDEDLSAGQPGRSNRVPINPEDSVPGRRPPVSPTP